MVINIHCLIYIDKNKIFNIKIKDNRFDKKSFLEKYKNNNNSKQNIDLNKECINNMRLYLNIISNILCYYKLFINKIKLKENQNNTLYIKSLFALIKNMYLFYHFILIYLLQI